MRGQAWILSGAAFAAVAVSAAPASAQSYGYGQPSYGYDQRYGDGGSSYQGNYSQDPMCGQERQNRALIGGAIGGLAGAVLGRGVAARNARTEGMVLGGLAGAAAGAAIGHNSAKCENRPVAQSYPYDHTYNQGYGGGDRGYDQGYGQGYGSNGGYEPTLRGGPNDGYGSVRNESGSCRWRDVGGRNVYMCRGGDGVWRQR